MRFSLIVLFLALLVAKANCCYSTGKKGDYGKWLLAKDTTLDQERLAWACSSIVGRGLIKFNAQEVRTFCIQQEYGFKWDFQLRYLGYWGTRAIKLEECLHGMRKEVTCLRGGKSAYWNWEYM